MTSKPSFRRRGSVLLLRAAVVPLGDRPDHWPAVDDLDSCHQWLGEVWSKAAFVNSLRVASPLLVESVEKILRDHQAPPKRMRKAVCSVAHYLLRATGRATPFGLFAGVATAAPGTAQAEFGTAHRAVARIDTVWLDHVRRDLQRRPDVLLLLDVRLNDLVVRRGATVETPLSDGRLATARITRPLAVLLDAAADTIPVRGLVNNLIKAGGTTDRALHLIGAALEGGILTSNLMAPMTETEPAEHIIRTLLPHSAILSQSALDVVDGLIEVRHILDAHDESASMETAKTLRVTAEDRMQAITDAGRARIGLDLHLDATLRIPPRVLDDAEHAAHALLRLTRVQGEKPAWAAYQTIFWERYGAGCLVPVREATDLASGVGLPADYPHSLWAEPPPKVLPRDEILMAKAWQAIVTGAREIRLTENDLDKLSSDQTPSTAVAPHVELAIRVRAASSQALDQGDFTLDVRPAWTIGNFTGRFAEMLGQGLPDLYRTLPTMVKDALPAQLSFTPIYPHGENVARIPALLPHVISIGEHRTQGGEVIDVDDLAVFSTGRNLHLVSISRRRVIEPTVLHPLALEKQAPPLARFLALLGRGFATHWTEFDWGPLSAPMPFLPQVSYRNAVLSPARWHLAATELPKGACDLTWHQALTAWATTWHCPDLIELRDDDRTLRLDLNEPLHARLLYRHLQRKGHAVLTETPADDELGWIGHAHEITLPLTSSLPPMPHPDLSRAPLVTNRSLAHPGDGRQRWLQAKVFTHPTVMNEVLTEQLPALLAELGDPTVWFTRYRSLQEEDHLRIRIAAAGAEALTRTMQALSSWAGRLTDVRLASRLMFDAYRPELGRYGTHAAMDAAEDVFVTDSLAVRYALADLPALDSRVLCALGMIDLAQGLLGAHQGLDWLGSARASEGGQLDTTRQTLHYARLDAALDASPRLVAANTQRRAALSAYQAHLAEPQLNPVLESLLHMHHNRIIGPDRESEATSRHAARQACRSLLAHVGAQ
ncbi:lantibiotic dehydratase [Streptomyces sp. NPDC054855]